MDYEGNRKTTSAPEELLVPTAAERAGNLSALAAIPGTPGILINPFDAARPQGLGGNRTGQLALRLDF